MRLVAANVVNVLFMLKKKKILKFYAGVPEVSMH